MFLRASSVGREPLAVAMSGVRMGERVLQVGLDDPSVTGALAAKPGLTGETTIVVADDNTAVRARRAIADAGALARVLVHPLDELPLEKASFDVAVIHNQEGLLGSLGVRRDHFLGECRRVLRSGGRVIVVERGTRSGFGGMFRAREHHSGGPGEETIRMLEAAGFRAVRSLADRGAGRFFEGLKVERGS